MTNSSLLWESRPPLSRVPPRGGWAQPGQRSLILPWSALKERAQYVLSSTHQRRPLVFRGEDVHHARTYHLLLIWAGSEIDASPHEGRPGCHSRVLLDDLRQLAEIEIGVGCHGRRAGACGIHAFIVRLEHKRQVQNGAAVAAVHDAGEGDAPLQGRDEVLERNVVSQQPGGLEVDRAQALVFAVVLIAVVVLRLGTVAAVVEEQRVAGLRAVCQPPKALDHVGEGGLLVLAIVEHHAHVAVLVALRPQIPLHGVDVMVASAELATGAHVVDAHEQGPEAPAGFRIDHAEGAVQVHTAAAAQHRNLRVASSQDVSHLPQQRHPRVVAPLAQGLDHGAGARAPCSTGARVRGKPK
mmetsp:Transcript_105274/g.282956  ORF Transcript_105274/g.282956 Transcript_105274/m.282956 type:complete len:354 (-) Transcript_105274:583-1644(-)